MNNTTKLIIAGGAGLGAFILYKVIKKSIDEKKESEKKRIEEEKQKAAEAEVAKKASEELTKSKEPFSKTAIKTYTPYQKRIMVLQELLGVRIDGDAGTQTNGKLDYYYGTEGGNISNEKRKEQGYLNLLKNGKGVVSGSNIEFYINELKIANTPRQKYNKSGASSSDKKAYGNRLLSAGKAVHMTKKPVTLRKLRKNSSGGYDADGTTRILNSGENLLKSYDFVTYDLRNFWVLEHNSFPFHFVVVDPTEFVIA